MIRKTNLAMVVLCLALCSAAAALGQEVTPGITVLRFLPGQVEPPFGQTSAPLEQFAFQDTVLRDSLVAMGVSTLERLFPDFAHSDTSAVNPAGESVVLPDLADIYVAHFGPCCVPDSVAARMGTLPGVAYAHPDYGAQPDFTPDDPLFPLQWGLENGGPTTCASGSVADADVNAAAAWDITRGSPSVRVAILDSGIDSDHPDLVGRVQLGPSYVGYTSSSEDDAGHGTACAGIVGASQNYSGASGVAPLVTLVSVKVGEGPTGPNPGRYFSARGAQGMNWTRTQGIPIVSMSYGHSDRTNTGAVYDAARAGVLSGQLYVASMGNDNHADLELPAGFGAVVYSVGAVQPNGLRWLDSDLGFSGGQGSNTGSWIDVAAPGGRYIATTKMGGGDYTLAPCTDQFGGTSAAAPLVAGIAALMKSQYSSLMGEEIGEIISRTARDVTAYGTNWDDKTGYGIPRADAALNYLGLHRQLSRVQATAMAEIGVEQKLKSLIELPVAKIPSGRYNVKVHRMRKSVAFGVTYTSPPDVWVRVSGTNGVKDVDPYSYTLEGPWGQVVPGTVTTTGCQVETYVYEVRAIIGGTLLGWYPTTTSGAAVAITAVGNVPDVTPPAPADDFLALGGCTTVRLSWTNTGDDGLIGQASSYEVRRSISPITSTTWSSAVVVKTGTPGPSGSDAEAFVAAGKCSPLYHYAIRLCDAAGNWSAVSPDRAARTACPRPPTECIDEFLALHPIGEELSESPPESFGFEGARPAVALGPVDLKLSVPATYLGRTLTADCVDLSGRVVRRLEVGTLGTSRALLHWDLRDVNEQPVSPGVYFIRVEIGRERLVHRLVVLR